MPTRGQSAGGPGRRSVALLALTSLTGALSCNGSPRADDAGLLDADRGSDTSAPDAAGVDGAFDAGDEGGDTDRTFYPDMRRGYVFLAEHPGSMPPSSITARFGFRHANPICGATIEVFGDCYAFTRQPLECLPPCADDERCMWNDQCTEPVCLPEYDPLDYFDPGPISIIGATHQPEVECLVEQDEVVCSYDPEGNLWEPLDDVLVTAPGSSFPAFSTTLFTPPPLQVSTKLETMTLEDLLAADPFVIEWTSPGLADAVELALEGPHNVVQCLSDDDGQFEIPAEAIAFLGADLSDSVTLSVVRSNGAIANEARDGEVKVYAESAATGHLFE